MTFLSVRSTTDILILDAKKRAPAFGDLGQGGMVGELRNPTPNQMAFSHSRHESPLFKA